MKNVILGAGLAGLSVAEHLEGVSTVYEKNSYAGGHIHSENIDGFTWDEGPHVSFTKNDYVKQLFEYNAEDGILEYPVKTGNYYHGSWIPHPAQTNLYAVPQPLRDNCLSDFLNAAETFDATSTPENYKEWLDVSLGHTFAKNFSAAYTRKYWTTEPALLTTDWVGERVFLPNLEQVKNGYEAPLEEETHYIKAIRYPVKGGYESFAKKMIRSTNIILNHELHKVDFSKKTLLFSNGISQSYERLISTIPLPILIAKSDAPENVKSAATALSCSSVLLVNVTANHTTQRPENWIYVYDENKFSTRINCTELLSPNNAPSGMTGIQVEVYFSKYRTTANTFDEIASTVCDELVEMGLLKSIESIQSVHTKWVDWANIIFDHQRTAAQETILNWLAKFGLAREYDDLQPMTDWTAKDNQPQVLGSLILAGRFAQWKYYWTDDCVLRGKWIATQLKSQCN